MKRINRIALIVGLLSTSSVAQTRIDRACWQGTLPRMRYAAIDGAIDCLVYDHGHKLPRTPGKSLHKPQLDQRVDAAFAGANSRGTLADVLMDLRLYSNSPRSTPGGESYPEKHGYFDEYYWIQSAEDERTGFLIGYLSCGRELRVPMSQVEKLQQQIESWYESHQAPPDAKEGRNEKIADVIAQIRKQNHIPKKREQKSK